MTDSKTDDQKASEMVEAFKPLADAAGKMKAMHSRGKWSVHYGTFQGGDGHDIVDGRDEGELSRIARVCFHDDAWGETRANAELLAAAPEMLEALQDCKWLLEKLVAMNRIPANNAALRNTLGAIVKATNQPPSAT